MLRAVLVALLLPCLVCSPAIADDVLAPTPVISIIIDDLGYGLADGRRAIGLPGAVACSVLPHTPHGYRLAKAAYGAGKEVLLHLPMQPANEKDPGIGALTLDTGEHDLRRMVAANLAAVPHVVGINNHMGSLLTRHPGHMDWLMKSLRDDPRGLFFVDSVTSQKSVALQMARENSVPAARRDLFLDRDPDPTAIAAQFERLILMAQERGSAVAIGHPYPETLDLLERELAGLDARGVQLVSVAEFIRRRTLENSSWHASLSRSQRDLKN